MAKIKIWNQGTRQDDEFEIPSLTNEQLLNEYAAEVDGDTRRISTDPPSMGQELRDEILKRMAK